MRAVLLATLLVAALLLAACATAPSAGQRRTTANALAARRGWSESDLPAKGFTLATFAPPAPVALDELWIYLEGDGLAFLSPDRISDDPTPIEPLALQLALAQPDGTAVYLARPCQYIALTTICSQGYWSDRRFAPEVIDAMDDAVTQLKARFGARQVNLVGYSGGGTVAVLIAARRHDIRRLVTVAGNLSVRRWVELKRVAPLVGSLDPIDVRDRLRGTPQWHFVGADDEVVPAMLTKAFAAGERGTMVIEEVGFDHRCCWVSAWPDLWRAIR